MFFETVFDYEHQQENNRSKDFESFLKRLSVRDAHIFFQRENGPIGPEAVVSSWDAQGSRDMSSEYALPKC
jgi:hypothetical protein